MHKPPYSSDLAISESSNEFPLARITRLRKVVEDIIIDVLPVFNVPFFVSNQKLEVSMSVLVTRVPEILDHDGRCVWQIAAEYLTRLPWAVGSAPEETEVARIQDCNSAHVARGVRVVNVEADVALNESWSNWWNLTFGCDRWADGAPETDLLLADVLMGALVFISRLSSTHELTSVRPPARVLITTEKSELSNCTNTGYPVDMPYASVTLPTTAPGPFWNHPTHFWSEIWPESLV